MKILVFSDTHGIVEYAQRVLEDFSDYVGGFIHLGDYTEDALRLRKIHGKGIFISVKGNCDFGGGSPYIVTNIMGHNFYICHGHRENVKYDSMKLVYRALENDCDTALYGHTHCPVVEEYAGVRLMNPGSISLPRQSRQKTFGILDVTEKSVSMTIYAIDGEKYSIIDRI